MSCFLHLRLFSMVVSLKYLVGLNEPCFVKLESIPDSQVENSFRFHERLFTPNVSRMSEFESQVYSLTNIRLFSTWLREF